MLSIIGTIFTFILFICYLPSWSKYRWHTNHTWKYVGVYAYPIKDISRYFLQGLSWSFSLVTLLIFILFITNKIQGFSLINSNQLFNAILLTLGVGFAEELIFRGWLFVEMKNTFGIRKGIIIQAIIFSLAHIRLDVPLVNLLPLLLGLFLFGVLLAFRRILDRGSIWGCIGLHGGMVGLWFIISSGYIQFAPKIPSFIIGGGQDNPNPLGGLISIFILLIILVYQRNTLFGTGRFFV